MKPAPSRLRRSFAAFAVCGILLAIAAAVGVRTREAWRSAPAPSAIQAPESSAQAQTFEGPAPEAPSAPPSSASDPGPPRTGTVRVAHVALAKDVWLDGERLTDPVTSVACGPHDVRIGAKGKRRQVTVPCNGELRLSK